MFQFHAISPGNTSVETFTKKALQIYDDVDYIHLRERTWNVQQFLSFIHSVKQHDPSLTKLIVNDRIDIAYITDICKVHLPSHGFKPDEVKHSFPTLSIGCSVHDVESAKRREQQGAYYLIYGHIYSTDSKENLQPRGLETLAHVVHSVSIPVIAIGGITPERVQEVKQTGAKGIAVMSGLFSATNLPSMTKQYRAYMNQI